MSDLLPCPFDGGEAIPDRVLRDGCQDGEPDAWAYFVRCRTCATEGPWQKSASGAAQRWNMLLRRSRKSSWVVRGVLS